MVTTTQLIGLSTAPVTLFFGVTKCIDVRPTHHGLLSLIAALDGWVVIYAYPMTGRPDKALPDGWNMIPGARGCTPQSCGFRDHAAKLVAVGVSEIYGLSVQDSDYQAEAAARLHLPFALLSDEGMVFADTMNLPRMEVQGETLLRRLTMIVKDGVIEKVFYPVFPPDQDAQNVIDYLSQKQDNL